MLQYFASINPSSTYFDSIFTPISMMHAALHFILSAASFGGISINGFAVGVNLWEWKYGDDLKAPDYYICSIALSNLSLQLWLGFAWLCDNDWHYDTFCRINFVLTMISTHFSLVLSGAMCVFFCSKIVMFNNWVMQILRQMHGKSYKFVTCRIFVLCLVLGLPLFWIKRLEPSTGSDFMSLNISDSSNLYEIQIETYFEVYKMFIMSFGYTCPVMMSLVSACCILTSLVKHMKRMRSTMENKHGVLLEAHRRTAYTVLSLLALILMHFVTSIIIVKEVFPAGDLGSVLCEVLSRLYPPIFGIVLIRSNSKLRGVAGEIKTKAIEKIKALTSRRENASIHIN
ncbi:taste receptor type 2 member 9-like [Anomaloglossus baeobatrachus]|uniref:taste receptor type 2 member 9-like n=1 Tax=Anomaloglossus baeobatrachus TaxID=238106 RepID=UPI003F50A52B